MLSLLKNPDSFRKKNKDVWESCWGYWYKKEYVHQGVKEYLLNEISSIKQEKGNLKLLDLGCGSAWCARYFQDFYDEYIGIDFNDALTEQLKQDFENNKKCHFLNHDLESSSEIPLWEKKFDLVLGNFILLELTDLENFFKKAAAIQEMGQYLIITGLDPLNEIVRDSNSFEEIEENLSTYRHATSSVVLSKKMSFNGDDTSFLYYRVLYSINDITAVASESGYDICEINDKLNKNAESPNSPIYYTIKLKRNAKSWFSGK